MCEPMGTRSCCLGSVVHPTYALSLEGASSLALQLAPIGS